jgi:hypothetical protein
MTFPKRRKKKRSKVNVNLSLLTLYIIIHSYLFVVEDERLCLIVVYSKGFREYILAIVFEQDFCSNMLLCYDPSNPHAFHIF